MEQNKTRAYLLYAIGEILLVMIGILLALQVNNWNNERVDQKLERVYIQNLIDDLENQLVELNTQKELETIVNEALERTMEKIADGFNSENIVEYNRDIQAITITRTLNLYDATFEDLKSTGNLNLIQNEELKQHILDYFQFTNRYVYVIRKNAEGYHHFIFEDFNRRELANFNINGMSGIVGIDSKMFELIKDIKYPDAINQEFNEDLLKRLSMLENRQAVKNAVNNRMWTNLVSLRFLTQLEDRTNTLITNLKGEMN